MKIIGIIPARYASTRLPGKPLKDICGKPMIQHVYERASQAKLLDKVVVATDDQRIADVVKAFGGLAYMTRKDHPTGSDRIAEVAIGFECDIVVNIQGDEPLIMPEIIDEIAQVLVEDSTQVMATGCYKIDEELARNPNVVKVVFDKNFNAMLFSRSIIPYPRNSEKFAAYEHIGIYAYTKEFLLKYITLPDTPLSQTESLEQLKVMENGYSIRVVPTKFPYNALSVDTQEDLDEVIRIMSGGR
jgi:3-deoxy-manno-octulosonate cytidylyltransferase (CMP-KDO synthetase)